MDKYSQAQLQSFPAAGVSILRTPDGHYVSPQEYADLYYPGLILPAGIADVVEVAVSAAAAPAPIVNSFGSHPGTFPGVTIRDLFSGSRSVSDPADPISLQVRGDPVAAGAPEKKTTSLLKLGLVVAVIWFLLGVRK